jgi:hypothetical protein
MHLFKEKSKSEKIGMDIERDNLMKLSQANGNFKDTV